MSSTKQRQEMARAARKAEKMVANDPNAIRLKPGNPIKLYEIDEILIDTGLYPIVQTPEGIQAYKTALVNVSYIPRGRQAPTAGFQTGYGCSYMAKVMSGTARAREILINVFANNDDRDDMLQISATEVDEKYNDAQMISQAIASLPMQIRSKFGNIKLKVESGTSPTPLGFAKVPSVA